MGHRYPWITIGIHGWIQMSKLPNVLLTQAIACCYSLVSQGSQQGTS